MPGPVSSSYAGPGDNTPYVPAWCYPHAAPKVCPCGHHEGYHDDHGRCLRRNACRCTGLPVECLTSDEEFSRR